jgi:hypothetical protein
LQQGDFRRILYRAFWTRYSEVTESIYGLRVQARPLAGSVLGPDGGRAADVVDAATGIGGTVGSMAQPRHVDPLAIPEELRPLVRKLAELPPDEREAVIEAARKVSTDQHALPSISWESLRAARGIVSLGGSALEDSEALYDE